MHDLGTPPHQIKAAIETLSDKYTSSLQFMLEYETTRGTRRNKPAKSLIGSVGEALVYKSNLITVSYHCKALQKKEIVIFSCYKSHSHFNPKLASSQ